MAIDTKHIVILVENLRNKYKSDVNHQRGTFHKLKDSINEAMENGDSARSDALKMTYYSKSCTMDTHRRFIKELEDILRSDDV